MNFNIKNASYKSQKRERINNFFLFFYFISNLKVLAKLLLENKYLIYSFRNNFYIITVINLYIIYNNITDLKINLIKLL